MSLSRHTATDSDRASLRRRLIAQRIALAPSWRGSADAEIMARLDALLHERLGKMTGMVLAAYWPMRGEPDIRALLTQWHRLGATVVLPVVVRPDAPMVFRQYRPEAALLRGLHGNHEPSDGPALIPAVVIAPCVGYSAQGFRLGYGGGYYDRSLAGLPALTIGLAYDQFELSGLEAAPHDVRLAVMLTERRRIDCAVPDGG